MFDAVDPQAVVTAAVGLLTTIGGVLAGRRIGRANASKVEAEALDIAASAFAKIVEAHDGLRASMAEELRRIQDAANARDSASAEKIRNLEERVFQLEADNSALRAELMARELIDTDDLHPRSVTPATGHPADGS